jgi:hypothetical protein
MTKELALVGLILGGLCFAVCVYLIKCIFGHPKRSDKHVLTVQWLYLGLSLVSLVIQVVIAFKVWL